jgi:hypothetical protein
VGCSHVKEFEELRATLFATRASFDSASVNIVLATDIFDKELNDSARVVGTGLLKTRSRSGSQDCYRAHHAGFRRVAHDAALARLPKVEHKLFDEMLSLQTRSHGADPSTFWYKGELDSLTTTSFHLRKRRTVTYSVPRATSALPCA